MSPLIYMDLSFILFLPLGYIYIPSFAFMNVAVPVLLQSYLDSIYQSFTFLEIHPCLAKLTSTIGFIF